ncbi:Meiosis-specific serine/threonine-protein kinase mek1 [Nowakowskiella sp. JEL0078]|nr:Meiosis-specific serine/threonine-protein kinase mek1 [Nowakowskiella sp. JEL0078]
MKPKRERLLQMATTTTVWGRILALRSNKTNLNGVSPAATYELSKNTYSFGRTSSCDIHIDSVESSRVQFVISQIGELICLQDTSTNGTWVNGKQVLKKKIALLSRTEIEIKHDHYDIEAYESQILKKRYYVFETNTLGKGSFAAVQLAIDLKTGQKLACKIIEKAKVPRLTSAKDIVSSGLPRVNIEQEVRIF